MRDFPVIPKNITVHLGAPDSNDINVTVPFQNYIKNVASSEIYPTWNKEALKANIVAQISVAMNRVYTEYYRSMGKNFDITNSPAYDQTYIYGRDIFDNISIIVDEIFNTYIRKKGNIEPLFAVFCDGIEVKCNGLYQWGSVELANQGANYEQILKKYYGSNIEIVKNAPQEDVNSSVPQFDLKVGDTGKDVELVQIKLNRISKNYPGIPKVYPVDGFFDQSTEDAVLKFQEVFGLDKDGIVGKATWNRINLVYLAVKELATVSSEGIKIDELNTRYEDVLKFGDSSSGVLTIQYYLEYISLFIPSVARLDVDGIFGEGTKNSILSYQKTYSLPETGEVDEKVWNSIENTYFGIITKIPYKYQSGIILPYPGRVLRQGLEGDDVRALQEYLNYIGKTYSEIPKIEVDGDFGKSTAEAVRAFKKLFNIEGDNDRVTAETWKKLISLYEDLFVGSLVNNGQYPGYNAV